MLRLLNDLQTLNVSIYHSNIKTEEFSFGEHAAAYKGESDFESIIKQEVESKNEDWGQDARLPVTGKANFDGQYAILTSAVSGTNSLRDHLHRNVRNYVGQRVRLVELEYQPADI